MARAGTVFVDVEGDYSKFEKDTKRAAKNIGGIWSNTFATALGNIAARAVEELSRKLFELGKEAIQFASELEVATLAFEQLAGGAGLEVLEQIKEMARTTPFQIGPMIQATRVMIGYGVEAKTAGELMQVVVDNVAAFGGNEDQIGRVALALGQVQAKGRVLGEELRQLNESGVQAQAALASFLGITQAEVLELARKGKISVEDLYTALLQGEGPIKKNAGFAEQASDTVVGAISNMKDAWNIAVAESMLPNLRNLKDEIKNELTPAVKEAADLLGPVFAEGAATMAEVFAEALPILADMGVVIGTIANLFGGSLAPMLERMAPMFQRLGDVILRLAEAAMPILITILESLGGGVMEILVRAFEALTPLLTSLTPILTELVDLVADNLADWISLAVEGLVPVAQVLLDSLLPVLTELIDGPLSDLVHALLPPLLELFAAVAPILGELAESVINVVTALIDELIPVIVPLMEALLPVLVDVLQILVDVLLDNEETIIFLVEAIGPLLVVGAQFVGLTMKMVQFLLPVIDAILSLTSVIIGLMTFIALAIVKAVTPFIEAFGELVEVITGSVGDALQAVKDFFGQMRTVGQELLQSLFKGMKDVMANIKSWVKNNIVNPIKNAITDFFGMGSPSKVMMAYGRDVAMGFQIGMEKVGFAPPLPDLAGFSGLAVAPLDSGPVYITNNGPIGGSMAEFAAQMEYQRAIAARFGSG